MGGTIIEVVVFCTFRGLQYFSELIDSRLLQRLFKITCLENLGGIFCIYLLHSTPISSKLLSNRRKIIQKSIGSLYRGVKLSLKDGHTRKDKSWELVPITSP